MVVADDRTAAVARLARALDEFEIGGLQTTLPFHRWLIDQPGFAAANDLSTDYVARRWQPAELVSVAALRAAQLAALTLPDAIAAAPVAPTYLNGVAASAWWRAGVSEATENHR
jgi:acetyl/propionyl-CoA carboxylase alpha subunit